MNQLVGAVDPDISDRFYLFKKYMPRIYFTFKS